MARILKNEEGVETPIVDVEAQATTEGKPIAAVSTAKKTVKIRASENIDCIIACTPYVIAKDKEAVVPADVAAILCFAEKAYRL